MDLELFPKITKCFILDLKEFENPLIIRFKYNSKTEQQTVAIKVDKPVSPVSDGKLPSPATVPDPAALKKEAEKKE